MVVVRRAGVGMGVLPLAAVPVRLELPVPVVPIMAVPPVPLV